MVFKNGDKGFQQVEFDAGGGVRGISMRIFMHADRITGIKSEGCFGDHQVK